MKKDFITVFTPTYNRGYLLDRLYQSLVRQTSKDFEWVIVDDGSTDDTKDIIDKFKFENKVNITYNYKENGGKHVAINRGVDLAQGELFFIVDSDDFLTDNAIEIILEYWNQVKGDSSFVGVAGLKGYSHDTVVGSKVNDAVIDATSTDYRYKYKVEGDRAEVFKTEMLKKYRFPELEGVKFITECTVWNKFSEEGLKLRWFNKIIYVCEYRDDGLTKNMFKIVLRNWKGTSYSNNEFLACRTIPIKVKIRNCMDYYHYGLYGGVSLFKLMKDCKCKWISIFGIPLSLIKLIYTNLKLKKA